MEREFKVGDRVVWHEGQSDEDFGVITHFVGCNTAYVDWESNDRNLPVSLRYIKHAEPIPNQKGSNMNQNLETTIAAAQKLLDDLKALRGVDNPLKAFTYKVKVSDFPEGAQWVAQDGDGVIIFFKNKPFINDGIIYRHWVHEDSFINFIKEKPYNPNWQQALCSLIDLQAYENSLKPTEPPKKEWPQIGDRYWVVTSSVYGLTFGNYKGFESTGNFFQTREEAEKEFDARKVIAELRKQPGACRFEFGKANISIRLYENKFVSAIGTLNGSTLNAYFNTHTEAIAAMEHVGRERIKAAILWLACGE